MKVFAMHCDVHYRISTTEDALHNHIEGTQSVDISHLLSSAIDIGMNRVDRKVDMKAMHEPSVQVLVFQE